MSGCMNEEDSEALLCTLNPSTEIDKQPTKKIRNLNNIENKQ
jgi:hypothetical protein